MELVFKTRLTIPWSQQRGSNEELSGAPAGSYRLKQNFIPLQKRRDVEADFSVP